MKSLFKYLKPYKKEMIAGPAFKLFEAILELTLPLIMAYIIDNRGNGISFIIKNSLLMMLIAVVGLGFALICQYYASIASQGFGESLRRAIMEKISGFSKGDLNHFSPSSLSTRLTSDVNQLQTAVSMLIRLVVRSPFLCIGAAVLAIGIDFKLSIIIITLIPVFIIVLYFVLFKTVPLYTTIQKKLDSIGSVIRENLSGVRVIRAFVRIPEQKKRFENSNDEMYRISAKTGMIAGLMNPITALIMNIALCAVLWFGGMRVYSGALSVGSIIAFISYITQIMLQMIIVANLCILYTSAFSSSKRVAAVLRYEPSVKEILNAERLPEECPDNTPAVSFFDVDFRYGDSKNAVTDITFEIKQGETVGIIGGTGSGKSTILNLLKREYDVNSGEIKIFGKDIRNCRLSDIHKIVAAVEQNPVLFSGTISSNLRMGNLNADENALRKAAQIAQADEFIEKLPDKYKSIVDRGGRNFSGGQRQRLAIARAITANAKILVLDDSTSALDYLTQSRLWDGINELKNKTSVVIISQRASSVIRADKIICLDSGKIAGIGTHSNLYDTCEIYREICISQSFSRDGTNK